jgi:4a-hydroxytetrahydrobiopterin dehydratase
MPPLSNDEIRAGLAGLEGWDLIEGPAIARQFTLGNLRDAVAFVVRVSFEAEAADHHPDVDIRYNRVRFTLSTHSEGGVTAKDLDLAAAIQRLAP